MISLTRVSILLAKTRSRAIILRIRITFRKMKASNVGYYICSNDEGEERDKTYKHEEEAL